ncbi:MAG TPA: hypothetical protein PK609_00705 [Candidatus Paceibacterota bacterium]|nr:hypothetical protein [Candidatus Paceibacterota bacterium]
MNNVQKLVAGTANLNRMRAEIKTIAGTITSMIDCRSGNHAQETSGVYWVIDSMSRYQEVYLYCVDSAVTTDEHRALYHSYQREEIGLSDVAKVHQSLEGFVEWAMSIYPDLQTRLKPILEAAEF